MTTLKRPPMCPTCAQKALGSLVEKRQAADADGDRAATVALDQQIVRMLSWQYQCAEPGLPPVVTLGEIVAHQRERRAT